MVKELGRTRMEANVSVRSLFGAKLFAMNTVVSGRHMGAPAGGGGAGAASKRGVVGVAYAGCSASSVLLCMVARRPRPCAAVQSLSKSAQHPFELP
jgi:hypothetical protein